MEPNKMEEAFRKKLNAREIEPSQAAWDRLDAMLSVTENKKPKRSFPWLYVAAGFAVFFALGLFLFPQVPQQNRVLPNTNNGMVTVETSPKEENALKDSDTMVPLKMHNIVKRNTVAEHQRQAEKKVATKPLEQSEVLSSQITNEEKTAIAAVTKSEPQKITVNAEQLLAEVTKANEKQKVKVNPNSLLSSVEGELNQEFRETTLDKIKKNFKTVKTAVVNRNYQ